MTAKIGFEVKPTFIWDFKCGDNIVYNLGILRVIYDSHRRAEVTEQVLLTKPIVIQIACVVEAVLYDLAWRIARAQREKVGSISLPSARAIRTKVERAQGHLTFRRLITILGESNVFDKDAAFYDNLHGLAERRNRLHISNEKGLAPRDEHLLFVDEIKVEAEHICEELVRICETRFSRGEEFKYVQPFWFPWSPHY